MAYNPADLKLPRWLLAALDRVVRLEAPVWPGWRLGVTRPGAMYGLAMLGVLAAAAWSGNNLLYLCAAMLLALAGLAVFEGVRLLVCAPDPSPWMPVCSTAGRPHVVRREWSLSSCASGRAGLIRLGWSGGGRGCSALLWLDGGGRAMLQAVLHAPARGLVRFSRLRMETAAPLGLWRLIRHSDHAGWTWLVLPASVPLPVWPGAGAAGSEEMAGVGHGDEWRDLRAYAPGDAPSRVHWRKSALAAESGGWLVKQFSKASGGWRVRLLAVDLRARPGPAFERLLGQARAWVESGGGEALLLGSRRLDVRDEAGRLAALGAIAGARPEGRSPAAGDAVLRVNGLVLERGGRVSA